MAREFSRTQRVADFLREELAQLIQFQLRDPRVGMASVTAVEVSRDLGHARVYVTVLGKDSAEDAAEAIAALNHAAGFLRSEIARNMKARTTPQLRFLFDASVGRGASMERLIADAVASDRRADGEADEGSETGGADG